MLYILDDQNNPVEVNAISKWEEWMNKNEQKVTIGNDNVGNFKISTVFVGIDGMGHARIAPNVFETTVLDDCDDIMEVKVYNNYSLAVQTHQELLATYSFGSN